MLATETDNDRPAVDEQYATAINAKSLVVVEHRGSAVDVLAAAAWSESRIGLLLLRLHSEYDGGERVRTRMSGTDVQMVRQRLKSLARAEEQVGLRAQDWRIEEPRQKARAALLWWLDHVCRTCQRRRWVQVADTPHLSGQLCPACRGSGDSKLPHGEDGRRLVGFIEDCTSRARDSIARRLRGRNK